MKEREEGTAFVLGSVTIFWNFVEASRAGPWLFPPSIGISSTLRSLPLVTMTLEEQQNVAGRLGSAGNPIVSRGAVHSRYPLSAGLPASVGQCP